MLLLTALIWTASSDVVQLLLAVRRVPVFIASLTNAEVAVLLLVRGAREAWARRRRRAAAAALMAAAASSSAADAAEAEAEAEADAADTADAEAADGGEGAVAAARSAAVAAAEADAFTAAAWRRAARAAAVVAPLFLGAQLAYGASLAATSVTASTLLSATSAPMTLAFSACALGERPRRLAVAGVALVLLGAALAGAGDAEGEARGVGRGGSSSGDALALLSAGCYAGYSVVLARALGGAAPPPADLVLGFVGLAALLTLGPLVASLHALGAEDLSDLPAGFIAGVLLKGLFDNVLSGQLWAHSVALGGPTLATVALSLTVPLAALSDALLLGRAPGALLAAGCAMTVLGFVSTAADEASAGAARGEGGGEAGVTAGAARPAAQEEAMAAAAAEEEVAVPSKLTTA